jgi:hypothetical protein
MNFCWLDDLQRRDAQGKILLRQRKSPVSQENSCSAGIYGDKGTGFAQSGRKCSGRGVVAKATITKSSIVLMKRPYSFRQKKWVSEKSLTH